jgi:hypothetical protein
MRWLVALFALTGCQNDSSGPQPSCVFMCAVTTQAPPVAAPLPAAGVDEEIILPPSRRSVIIRRFAQ